MITLNVKYKDGLEESRTYTINKIPFSWSSWDSIRICCSNDEENYLKAVTREFLSMTRQDTFSWPESLFLVPDGFLRRRGINMVCGKVSKSKQSEPNETEERKDIPKHYVNKEGTTLSMPELIDTYRFVDHSIYPTFNYWLHKMVKKGVYSPVTELESSENPIADESATGNTGKENETAQRTSEPAAKKYYVQIGKDGYPGWEGRIVSEEKLRELYFLCVNKDVSTGGYPDFESWLIDMLRTCIFAETKLPKIHCKRMLNPKDVVFFAERNDLKEIELQIVCSIIESTDDITDEILYILASYIAGHSSFVRDDVARREDVTMSFMKRLESMMTKEYVIS